MGTGIDKVRMNTKNSQNAAQREREALRKMIEAARLFERGFYEATRKGLNGNLGVLVEFREGVPSVKFKWDFRCEGKDIPNPVSKDQDGLFFHT